MKTFTKVKVFFLWQFKFYIKAFIVIYFSTKFLSIFICHLVVFFINIYLPLGCVVRKTIIFKSSCCKRQNIYNLNYTESYISSNPLRKVEISKQFQSCFDTRWSIHCLWIFCPMVQQNKNSTTFSSISFESIVRSRQDFAEK